MSEEDEKLAKKYILQRGMKEVSGWCISSQELNPDDYEYIYFQGETLEDALKGLARKTTYWVYEPSDGEQCYEDIWDALEYVEEISDVSFDDFKKSEASDK